MNEEPPRDRPDGESGDDQERRLHEEREKAGADEHDAAGGPGYTARPSDEGPEEGADGAPDDG